MEKTDKVALGIFGSFMAAGAIVFGLCWQRVYEDSTSHRTERTARELEILYGRNYYSPIPVDSHVAVIAKNMNPAHKERRTSGNCGSPTGCMQYFVTVADEYEVTASFCPISEKESCVKDNFPVSEELYQESDEGDTLTVAREGTDGVLYLR